jgi:protoporphyrinogen oxidase
VVVIGGGVSGLFCGFLTGAPIYEQNAYPGGLLASYCFNPYTGEKSHCKKREEEAVLFEIGGGHWLWGIDNNEDIYNILRRFSDFKRYLRRSSVYLTDYDLFVPYPLQYHIRHLPRDLRDKTLEDIITSRKESRNIDYNKLTFAEFLRRAFGETLYKTFFEPYNYSYTAGLLYEVAPPRRMKVPDDIETIIKGSRKDFSVTTGYNAYFYYPVIGLGPLMWRLYDETKCHLGHRVTSIDIIRRQLIVNDNNAIKYDIAYVAIPLLKILEISDMKDFQRHHDPYTSVLVINVLAKRGRNTPKDHWVYVSRSKSGFHRIGYYSNVDEMFLPKKYRSKNYVSAYIEKTFRYDSSPTNLNTEVTKILKEVEELNFIGEVIALDYNFVEIAYTWQRPSSTWADNVIHVLSNHNIITVGRYAKWGKVEGIVESMKDAFKTCFMHNA